MAVGAFIGRDRRLKCCVRRVTEVGGGRESEIHSERDTEIEKRVSTCETVTERGRNNTTA